MATFPTALPSYLGFTASHTLSADQHASQHNSEQGDITAIATKIGIGASVPAVSKLLRGTGTGTSAWAQADLTSDVTGVLPVANGGTGTTATTGAGSVVFATSPTLVTPALTQPTIADFTNAIHSHANNAGGGQLNAANALQTGSVSFANLLATIFSGQIQTQANAGTAGGTFSYVNLGGLKILWINTANQTTSSGGNSYTLTLPVFFNSITYTGATSINQTVTNNQYAVVASSSTSSISVVGYSPAGAASAGFGVLIIGT